MFQILKADTWTGSMDGTGYKHANTSHISSVMGKTSGVQLEVVKELLVEYLEIYNGSLLGKDHPLALAEGLCKLVGWGSDHAKDQKKCFWLLSDWKQQGMGTLKTWQVIILS
ncbi:uncharacterized protein C8Q71DRAFT_726621 [Rhodofomes roseus]|uniref:Uncharacterized protein n=1 Tax=Rhodofomes roseus TaxID=34475 RepID=A0ABQ8K4B7_9APHY|nr:uncharacterized protein C8Q71DRAFT_726621 [Rhodofomes roseus]KAH9831727.1 hypothetical protein C8Q71DRAFT_726621 [Rhodofomes roseus]